LTVGGDVYCSRCTAPAKDQLGKYIAKGCSAPADCGAVSPSSTTTSTPTTSSTSTTLAGTGTVLKGALTPTSGRFNYNLTIGVPGSDAACTSLFGNGVHTCTYADLQAAESAGDLVGLKDTANTTVTSFWAIDSSQPDNLQCTTTVAWDYQTAHTGRFGQLVNL